MELPSIPNLILYASTAIAVIAYLLKLRDANNELKRQVKIMWGAQVNRGRVEAEISGTIIPTPPWLPDLLDQRVREHFGKMRDDLRTFYRAADRALSFDRLLLEIEGLFGKRIVDDVCRPLGLTQAACLHAAAIIARETDTVQVNGPQ